MTSTRKLIAAASIAGGVAVGSIAGALVGAPVTSGAQESTDGTTAPAAPAGAPEGGRMHRGPFDLEAAAEAIGITVDELRTALQADDTTSIADVATANGVDPQAVIDALVADATTRIDEAVADGDLDADRATEIKAELPERIADIVNRDGGLFGGHGPGGMGGPGFGFRGASLEAAADAIGITVDELRTALQADDTTSIADVATANGVDPQAVIDALVADATTRIDEAVADGNLDADRAEEIKAELPERIADFVNREGLPEHGPGGGFGGPGGPGFGHGGPRPDGAPEESSTTS